MIEEEGGDRRTNSAGNVHTELTGERISQEDQHKINNALEGRPNYPRLADQPGAKEEVAGRRDEERFRDYKNNRPNGTE